MDKLHSYAKKIVESLYGKDVSVKQGKENSFDYVKDRVTLDLRDDAELGFTRHLINVHGFKSAKKFSPMLWTLLHELGHYETQDDYDEDEYEDSLNTKLALACVPPEEMEINEDLQDQYFNTVEEWLATEWAIDFIKHNR